MKINNLILENFRCFENFTISFHPECTVIVAKNGSGKTAILDAVAIAFGSFLGSFDEGKNIGFDNKRDARRFKAREVFSSEMEEAWPIKLEADGNVHDVQVHWKRQLTSFKSSTTTKETKPLIDHAKFLQNGVRSLAFSNLTVLPLVAYYGTGRLWSQKKLTLGKKSVPNRSRMAGYIDALDPSSSFKLFAEWLKNSTIAQIQVRMRRDAGADSLVEPEVTVLSDSIRHAVNTVLEISGWRDIIYDAVYDDIVMTHPKFGTHPVSTLSDGVRNMIGMVADIAYRMARLNSPLGGNVCLQTPGIVLIDEVDMHLHPEWQQIVVSDLKRAFPKIQFIVTTHSPQVLTSLPVESIRILSKSTQDDERSNMVAIIPNQQTLGVASNDVLAAIMDVDPVPDVEQARMLSQFRSMIQQGNHENEEGQILKNKLDAHYGVNHPLILECDRMIRLEAMKRKFSQSTKNA